MKRLSQKAKGDIHLERILRVAEAPWLVVPFLAEAKRCDTALKFFIKPEGYNKRGVRSLLKNCPKHLSAGIAQLRDEPRAADPISLALALVGQFADAIDVARTLPGVEGPLVERYRLYAVITGVSLTAGSPMNDRLKHSLKQLLPPRPEPLWDDYLKLLQEPDAK